MLLGRVKGNVISTHKNQYLLSHKLMLVQKIDVEGNYIGNKDLIAVDLIDSGIGDIVLVTQEGDAVQQILGHQKAPINSIIVAIVDDIDIK